jgi:hypothetical protein
MGAMRMNGLPERDASTLGPPLRPVLSRNAFVATLVVVAAWAASARAVPGVVDTTAALVRGVADNKLLWVCLGIAVWHLLRQHSPTVGGGHLLAAIPALLLSAVAGGIWPWIGLSLSLLLLLSTTPGLGGGARTGVLLALIAALHAIAIDLLGELSGDAVLGIEARIARLLASCFLPDLEVEGNALQMPGGHMVVLVWGCSSLSNLGDALLLFFALVSLRPAASSTHFLRGRFVGCVVLLACIAITLNMLRLTLMARDPGAYAYLHGSEGAAWFRLATLGITALMSRTVLSR